MAQCGNTLRLFESLLFAPYSRHLVNADNISPRRLEAMAPCEPV